MNIERLGGTEEGKGGYPCIAVKASGLDLGDCSGRRFGIERLGKTIGGGVRISFPHSVIKQFELGTSWGRGGGC